MLKLQKDLAVCAVVGRTNPLESANAFKKRARRVSHGRAQPVSPGDLFFDRRTTVGLGPCGHVALGPMPTARPRGAREFGRAIGPASSMATHLRGSLLILRRNGHRFNSPLTLSGMIGQPPSISTRWSCEGNER
jgi:hypothetical protein